MKLERVNPPSWPRHAFGHLWRGPANLPSSLDIEWRLVAIRWLGIMVMTPILGLFHMSDERLMATYGVLVGAAAYNAMVYFYLQRRPALFMNGYVTTLGDALLTAAMITLGGGFDTSLYFLLFTVTSASAMRYGYGPASVVALFFIGFDVAEHRLAGLGADGAVVLRSGFLVMTGILASYLREQARHAEAALQVQLRHAKHEALHDRLTGLPNRALLTDRIQQALQEVSHESTHVALLFIDMNRFKEVNDTFGHRCGDMVLKETGRRLLDELPESATLARLSGDEFAIVLPGADLRAASRHAIALLRALEQPLQVEELSMEVSASIGIAVAPDHGMEADLLQRRADIAMYVAKSRRPDYAVYTPEQDMHSRDRLELAADLRRAIDRGELSLAYQPIVSISSGRIEEVEALLRWRHPVRGEVSPSQFIPLAEETGAIVPIGRWVLQEACRQAVKWRSTCAGTKSLVMSVNLSARQFQHADVPAEIRAVLHESGLDPRALKLEITESIAMLDPEINIASLWLLKGMGIRVAIDDFGTGYSSLGYLKRFPAETLKIDKTFVDGLVVNPEDEAIVAATVAFARAVGLTTTAEGVEHADQLACLRRLGADRVQGYLCAKPLAAAEFEELLRLGRPLIAQDSWRESANAA